MLNDRKYKQIVNEWFARLQKGYALPPYTEDELQVLDEVLNNHKIKKPEAVNGSSISIIDETLDVQIEESEIRKIFIPIEASLFENDDAESVTASQLQTLRDKIKSPELKERYSKYLSVFYYFAPNALGEISEILLAKLLGGSHTGASQGLEDLNVDGISISLKTTAGGKNINLGSYKNLSPKDKVLDQIAYLSKNDPDFKNMTVNQIIAKYNSPEYSDMISDIKSRINAIAVKLAGENNNEYFVWVEKISKDGVLNKLRIHTQKFNKNQVIQFLNNSNIIPSSKGWAMRRDGTAFVGADNTGKYLNINPKFINSKEDVDEIEMINYNKLLGTPTNDAAADKLIDRLKGAASNTFFELLDSLYNNFITKLKPQ